MSKRKKTCRSHCRACDSCFTGDKAFDTHRFGSHEEGTRNCWPPITDEKPDAFVMYPGECRVSQPETRSRRAIHGLWAAMESAKYFSAGGPGLPVKRLTASKT